MTNPTQPGKYLALVFEWVGLPTAKPKAPEWVIKTFNGAWQRERYTYDTGGYENLEVVRWGPLPPVDADPSPPPTHTQNTTMAKSPAPPVAPPIPDPVPEAKSLQHARTFLEIKNVGCVIETLIYSEDGRMSVASVFIPGVYVHPMEGGPGELRKL